MTEVPEHLLRRSQERRAALGLGGGDGAPEAPAGGSGGEPSNVPARAAAAEVAAPAAAVVAEPEPVKPLPPYVEASLRRPRVPTFAIPVLAALPLWALLYAGTLFQPHEELDPIVARGRTLYATNCSGCHGAAGQGGTGRPLGDVLKTFPDRADHIAWVENGSPAAGTPYGATGTPSQSGGFGPMPGFKDSLSAEDIAAIVRYEREVFGGEEPPAEGEAGSQAGTESDADTESEEAAGKGGNVGGDTSEDHGTGTTPAVQK